MNVQYKSRSYAGHEHSQWRTVAAISLCVAVLSFVSPQVGMLGHGLRTTLPALVIAWFAIHQISRSAFISAFMRFRAAFLLGSIFVIQAALRFAYADGAGDLWRDFFWGPFLALAFLLWIGAYAELGMVSVRKFRGWLLFGWCVSLVVSLPVLIENPGVARSTMGSEFAETNAAIWAPYGVGEYSVYTTFAICFSTLLAVGYRLRGVVRWPALILVCLAGSTVVLSTFTMASVLLMVSFLGVSLAWVRAGRGWSLMWRSIMIPLAIAMLFLLYSQTSQLPQTDRIVSKVERLYRGISTDGLARGDETARGEMFVEGMRSFSHEPFLGYIPHVTGKMGAGGHSSLADSLVLFGLFGASLWFAALWRVFVGCLRHGDSQAERDALFISWIGLVLGGILNPLWHMTASLSALFALTVPPRKIAIQCKAEGTLTRPFVSAPATDGDRMAQEPRVGRNLHRPL